MIDHIIITVADYAAAKAFYVEALRPLGYDIIMEFGPACGLGVDRKPDFWIREAAAVRPSVHVAFASSDRATVDRFYAAAMAAGGHDNGPPGLRPDYHPDYYGAFVLDPDGNNIEAVCHRPATDEP
jgi:catechol 2,3-dioxygenase-like lactoylglutathione lyase family enzyme